MKKVVIVFGLISGVISSAMMFLTLPLINNGTINFDNGLLFGYTAIFLRFLLVFFGIRSYRENAGGTITFGPRLQRGHPHHAHLMHLSMTEHGDRLLQDHAGLRRQIRRAHDRRDAREGSVRIDDR